MSQTKMKTWPRVLVPVLLLCCLTYYCLYVFTQSRKGVLVRTFCGRRNISQKWESLNFNMSRKEKLFLNLEDFFWQQYLSTLSLPYGIMGSELFLVKVLAAMTSYDMSGKIKNLPCRTCVVVGNGFIVRNSSLGSAINNYDIVIRLNDAPVRGYEDDVGNKTTMRLFYPESASFNPGIQNDPGTLMVLVPFKQKDVIWLKEILYNEKRTFRKGFWRIPPQIWLGEPSQIRILDPYFMHQTASRLLHLPINSPKRNQISSHPTTGILAIYVALNFCDVVHIAGFGYPDSKNVTNPIHYYGHDTMKAMQNSYHNLSSEGKALKRLEDSGAIVNLCRSTCSTEAKPTLLYM